MKLSKRLLSLLLSLIIIATSFSAFSLNVGAVSGSSYTSNKYVASRIDAILKEFPVGSYFSNTGKACKCHSSGCSYNNGCDCISVYKDPETGKSVSLKSVQCMAFARYCFYKIFGFLDRDNSNYYSVGSLSSSKMTVSNVKALIGKAKTGAHIRAKYSHSMILLSSNSSGLTVLHSNSTGKCQVSIYTMTWDKFVSLYKSCGIDYVNMPKTYPSSDTAVGSSSSKTSSTSPKPSSVPESSVVVSSKPVNPIVPQVSVPAPSAPSNDPTVGAEILMGDVDSNNVVDTTDAYLVLKHTIMGLTDEIVFCEEAADVDQNGIIDTVDSLYILQFVIGTRDSFD